MSRQRKKARYRVVKTYGHERGLSCIFRQWRAKSHCRYLHGYALGFSFVFECSAQGLTNEGWVIDFGDLNKLEKWLHEVFDHTFLLAKDDPLHSQLRKLADMDPAVTDTYLVDATGCEAFAKLAYEYVAKNISTKIVSVEVFEHGANKAIYIGGRDSDES